MSDDPIKFENEQPSDTPVVGLSLAAAKDKKDVVKDFIKKHFPFLFDVRSLFYFILFLVIVSLGWCAWSLWNNYFTQLYGWDYEHQYVCFYYTYWDTWHEFFRTGHFNLYSYNTFLGTDNIGSNSYYGLFDPFVTVMILFPRVWIPQMTAITTFAKLIVTALLMRGYLKYMGISEWTARIGAVACAFSGFVNFMVGFPNFVSAAIYAPMILWGIEKVIRERKPTLLVFAIFLEGITSFFMLVPLCIWGVMYALFRFFQTFKQRTWKKQLWVMGLGIGSFAVGLALCSWVLLPSIRESSLSGRTVSIGSAYFHALLESLKTLKFGRFFQLIFTPVGENPGRELMALVSFFYPTSGYLYLPLTLPNVGVDYHYDAWTASIFCYTFFAILFFLGIIRSAKEKKWSHFIAIAIILYFLFTTFAYYFFFAFSGNGYGRWFFVLIPVIIYYGCWAFDGREKLPKWSMTAASLMTLICTIGTYALTLVVLKGKTFEVTNGMTYWPSSYMTAGETQSGETVVSSRMWYVYYQTALVIVEGVILIFFHQKKWSVYPILIITGIEAIVMGNCSFEYGSYYSLNWFQGGPVSLSKATSLADTLKEEDQSFYRSYFDSNSDPKNYAMAVGYNGTATFHSLANFGVMDYGRMVHMAESGSGSKTYGGERYYNASWAAAYFGKRFSTDAELGIKYYAIKKDGYGEFQGHNVPFGSTRVFNDDSYYFNNAYEVYRNDSIPELGHAVDSSKLYYMQAKSDYGKNSYNTAFYGNYWGAGRGSMGGAERVMFNEDFMLEGAIIDDDVVLDGMSINKGTPIDEGQGLSEYAERYRKRYFDTNKIKKTLYITNGPAGDLFLDYDIRGGAYYKGEHYNEGPAYFFNDDVEKTVFEGNSLKTGFLRNGNYVIPRDCGHFVLSPLSGTYFNNDPTGAYFTLHYPAEEPVRVILIGDTFENDGVTVKESNALLTFEYHALESTGGYGSYYGNYGLYAEGRVKYIIFESNGPCGSEDAYNTVEIPSSIAIYMQERHEAYSIDNPGDSIEARSRIINDPEYRLNNVKRVNNDEYTFSTDFPEDRVVVTQIGYDEGWQAYANGKEIKTFRVDGGFVGFLAPKGDAEYKLTYMTPYLKGALGIASAGFMVYVSYMCYDFVRGVLAIKKAGKDGFFDGMTR